MKPSLDGAYARILRAGEHLKRLEREERSVLPNVKFIENYEKEFPWSVLISYDDAPPILSILIGEIIYNLRAALDYLIYELAFLDSSSIQENTQFPIEDTPEGWQKRCSKGHAGFVQFLSVTHQTAIKALQPAFGCNWSRDFRNVSNPDKHKRLALIHIRFKDEAAMPEGMQMEGNSSSEIAFNDRTPVIETLKIFKSEICAVIDSFKSEF